jgi:hypothetical protein
VINLFFKLMYTLFWCIMSYFYTSGAWICGIFPYGAKFG